MFRSSEGYAMPDEQQAKVEQYRGIARELRHIAAGQRFDMCRHDQLIALADGFDRLADRVEREIDRVLLA